MRSEWGHQCPNCESLYPYDYFATCPRCRREEEKFFYLVDTPSWIYAAALDEKRREEQETSKSKRSKRKL